MTPDLLLWLTLCCSVYQVEPAFARAVMVIESREQIGPLGRKGTFIGPFGIHKDFRKKWDIDDPRENIRVGVAALRGKDKLRVLRRYNTKSNRSYEQAVMACYRQYRGAPVQSTPRMRP